MALSKLLNPNDSIRSWLTTTLPLVVPSTTNETPVAQVIPVNPVAAAPQSRNLKTTAGDAADKALRKRSPKTKTKTATAQ